MSDHETIILQQSKIIETLENENRQLKEILFCCGEVAVGTFDDTVVGLVDKTIGDFKIPETRFHEILQSIKTKRQDENGQTQQ